MNAKVLWGQPREPLVVVLMTDFSTAVIQGIPIAFCKASCVRQVNDEYRTERACCLPGWKADKDLLFWSEKCR